MKLTAQVKLTTNKLQSEALKETMKAANAVCNSLSEWAWANQTFRQFPLHKGQYHAQRALSGLTAQSVVRCIAKVSDSYKMDKDSPHTFKPFGAIPYDDRIVTWYTDKQAVSIWTTQGRIKLSYECGEYQNELLKFRQGECDLVFTGGNFYLLATVSIPDPPLKEFNGVIGIDLGIVNIATTSDGKTYCGEASKGIRSKTRHIRSLLQRKGTRNAKRHLRKISRRQSNYTTWLNHNISKQLVQSALSSHKALALEDLTGIRERANGFNREMRYQMGNWSFDQLKQFVLYKAKRAGVTVIFVDPRNTSRTCNVCGYCDKANRKSQSVFHCLKCGHHANADENAALNIMARGSVNTPNDALHAE